MLPILNTTIGKLLPGASLINTIVAHALHIHSIDQSYAIVGSHVSCLSPARVLTDCPTVMVLPDIVVLTWVKH